MHWIVRLLLNAVALLIVAAILPGIEVHGVLSAIVAALILGVVNTFVGSLLRIVSLPITVLTFGLFTFVINALCFWLAAALTPGFVVHGFLAALVGALLTSVIGGVLHRLAR
ncbi:membrane protein [Alicyclobacillus cellulosilyticus]|uniref:Membrane protein n=1 Tax=Alicyclobacillus cellulosilyticus TaxID=1003997 RepID=A0A917K7J3_9BACL|nr:phage holin family protein [Alicyclobacillus cellulosilyticus]GGJ03964.1 membrane protein [Alicyclobacillus cellulosilyticus]